jgi:hypothetical protein
VTSIDLFRQTVKFATDTLEDTLRDVDQDLATWASESQAICIAGHYAHVVADQDYALHGILRQGATPLVAGEWRERAGMSEMPPGPGLPFDEWSRTTQLDFAQLRDYAGAVYAASEEQFATMTDADLDREVDLSQFGLGTQPLLFVLLAGWVGNPLMHCGEISLLKGLHGLRGYTR